MPTFKWAFLFFIIFVSLFNQITRAYKSVYLNKNNNDILNVDYIIVGCGLAGIHFCEKLKENNKSFVVFDDKSQTSSLVAGGLYNPVVLKRFTSVWKSTEQIQLALPIYNKIEKECGVILDHKTPVYRRFTSVEEQNNWFVAADKPELSTYLSSEIIKNENPAIEAPFGFGKVLETGRIDTQLLIESYKKSLLSNQQLVEESFNYDSLQISDTLQYKYIRAKHIVFAEGFGIIQNLFFNHLPLKEAKGELLVIHAPDLKIDYVLKSSVFLIPLGKDLYTVGATYNWKDKTNAITQQAREELLNKLKTFLKCDFEVVDQVAGIRPTVSDRRPLVGKHTSHKNMFVLNGLGTRGVMIAPYIAKQLYEFIELSLPLEEEINIERFIKY
ncbi:glycine/D-amino acid oxidase-like deaminating enzyme [Oceanihabitans sediminis]|uniref:FAD-binding oxidoreductase n=1 Tax=Oceanihabitans sediminis TaxID=1812012 RepID=A0A368P6K6_9FLAO|nr:glycine/D-amino acid oxidase-like deaminating enzyme [Oceanihabitans sediminis]RCU57930.1 FAD-binding oxidoreductase [Oceanihabitans sediminis]